MTPLIKSQVRLYAETGADPTELQWFDATACFNDQHLVLQGPLYGMRPPFDRCMVCWEGKTTTTSRSVLRMHTSGVDPEVGICVSVWRLPYGVNPKASPPIVYVAVDGKELKYLPLDAGETIDPREAQMVLGFMAAWLDSLSQRSEAYVPVVNPTFTNKRKIAQGKLPAYEWRTVIIEPVQVQREQHQGGTHASPRLHDRRGHLRRLKSGKNVWVNACKVGDAARGIVFHDYKIAPSNQCAS